MNPSKRHAVYIRQVVESIISAPKPAGADAEEVVPVVSEASVCSQGIYLVKILAICHDASGIKLAFRTIRATTYTQYRVLELEQKHTRITCQPCPFQLGSAQHPHDDHGSSRCKSVQPHSVCRAMRGLDLRALFRGAGQRQPW